VKTYPLFKPQEIWHSAASDVLAQHKPEERRQGAPLFQHRRESSAVGREDRTADGFVSGRDQRSAAGRVRRKTLEVFDEQEQRYTTMSLFPDDREVPADAVDSVQVRLSGLELRLPRISATVGWRASCGANWGWMSFSNMGCRKVGKRCVGRKCCGCWW
jgi:hypothetical protein